MAAQYIDRNEFTNGLNALYAKITRYIDSRFENLNIQQLADRAESTRYTDVHFNEVNSQLATDRTEHNERFNKIETRLDNVEGRLDKIETILTDVVQRQQRTETILSDVVTHQQTMLETFQSTSESIIKSIADSHAILMERINDIDKRTS